jgi:hypothetical protein
MVTINETLINQKLTERLRVALLHDTLINKKEKKL